MGASTGEEMHELSTLSSRWLHKNHNVFYQTGDFSWYLSVATDAVALPVLCNHSQLVCDAPREPPPPWDATCAEYIPQPLPSLGAGRGWSWQTSRPKARFSGCQKKAINSPPVLQSCNTAPTQPPRFLRDPLPSVALAALKVARCS